MEILTVNHTQIKSLKSVTTEEHEDKNRYPQ